MAAPPVVLGYTRPQAQGVQKAGGIRTPTLLTKASRTVTPTTLIPSVSMMGRQERTSTLENWTRQTVLYLKPPCCDWFRLPIPLAKSY
jgi:hypothetical protein